MSKREKLRQRIEQHPKNVRFDDLHKLLKSYGFELRRTKGSHHSFIAKIAEQEVLLVIPYRQPLKAVYVKQALELIKKIEAYLDEAEDDEDE